ncbi:MAG: hypothetical protein HYY12_06145 [Candidatus Methylomirabilis oxyfera]|nr:hypothetical protein [Candidatus Methylomirabilis oxyfera]
MKRLFMVAVITGLVATMASISWASANLNLSKSNINIVVYSTNGMTSRQAAALVAALDRTPRVDDAAVKQALGKLFIPNNFKLIRIIPGRPTRVLLLTNPAQVSEAAAMATTVRGSKSNSDN